MRDFEKLKIKRRLFYAYCAGALVLVNVSGLFQDIMGQEAYLHRVQEHWVDSRITGPIHVVLLILCVLWYIKQRNEIDRM